MLPGRVLGLHACIRARHLNSSIESHFPTVMLEIRLMSLTQVLKAPLLFLSVPQ